MATPQQKAFCVLEFRKTDAFVAVQRAFRTEFDIDRPHRASTRRWDIQFKETGCLCKGTSPGRAFVSEGQVEKIHDAFEKSLRKSTRRAIPKLAISRTTVWRVLKRKLHIKPYKLSLHQILTNDDKEMRRKFCESMLEMVKDDVTLFSRLVCSDEVTFGRSSGNILSHQVQYREEDILIAEFGGRR